MERLYKLNSHRKWKGKSVRISFFSFVNAIFMNRSDHIVLYYVRVRNHRFPGHESCNMSLRSRNKEIKCLIDQHSSRTSQENMIKARAHMYNCGYAYQKTNNPEEKQITLPRYPTVLKHPGQQQHASQRRYIPQVTPSHPSTSHQLGRRRCHRSARKRA